jgi:hypothetical protein
MGRIDVVDDVHTGAGEGPVACGKGREHGGEKGAAAQGGPANAQDHEMVAQRGYLTGSLFHRGGVFKGETGETETPCITGLGQGLVAGWNPFIHQGLVFNGQSVR